MCGDNAGVLSLVAMAAMAYFSGGSSVAAEGAMAEGGAMAADTTLRSLVKLAPRKVR
jgi:hypothetical protein